MCDNESSVIDSIARYLNPLEFRGSYSATYNNMKLVHWLLVGGYWGVTFGTARRGLGGAVRTGRDRSPPRPLLAVPNAIANPSTVSVPITVLLYNGQLLCGFNVPIKG